MPTLFSRLRYEVLALAVALVCVGLHLLADGASSTGEGANVIVRAVQLLEGRVTDLKFRVRGERPAHPDVVVAAVDEKGAQKYGLWPWNRALFASAIDHLVDAGASVIALDIEFADPATDDGAAFRDLLGQVDAAGIPEGPAWAAVRAELALKGGVSPDAALAAALKKAGGRVVQGVIPYGEADAKDFAPEKAQEHLKLIEPHLIRKMSGKSPGASFELEFDQVRGWSAFSVQTPLPQFALTGGRMGHFAALLDADGSLRREALLVRLSAPRAWLPSLSVQAAAAHLGAPVVPVYDFRDKEVLGVRLSGSQREVWVPFQNNEPYTPINYPGPGASLPTLSLRDVIDGTFEPSRVKGKVVFIGVTLVGASGDQRVTPFSQLEPGVYVHAAFASNILSGDFLSRPPGLVVGEVLAMLLLALALARLVRRFDSFRVKALLMAGAALAWLVVDQLLFARGVQMATVVPLINVLGTSFGVIFLGYLSTDREKRQQRKTFERYLGADVLEEALLNPEKLDRGEKREMTVLFSDIRGFTTLSERMLPDKLASFINGYLSPMTQLVFEEKGTLDKYIGDAVMAFWNAPLDQADHALRACRAAMRMLAKLEELKLKWRAENYPEFDIGIGINSGPMIVGNMGSDVRVDYTVMGDAVNLASRLEGANKEYETRVIIGEGTYDLVKGQVTARRLGAVRVKGKRKPVNIYELRAVGVPQGPDAAAISAFDKALEAYTHQHWDEACAAFAEVLALWPNDPPARRYLEEIDHLRKNPPGSAWDGVYTATTK